MAFIECKCGAGDKCSGVMGITKKRLGLKENKDIKEKVELWKRNRKRTMMTRGIKRNSKKSKLNKTLKKTKVKMIKAPSSKVIHKSKYGRIDRITPAVTVSAERSRSRDESRERKRIIKSKTKASATPIIKKAKTEYFPLSTKQQAMEGRWMANEDLNIWMYVK